MAAKSRNYMAAFIGGLRQSMKETSTAEPKTSGGSIKHIPEVIEQYTARSGMDMKMAKTCYHSHCAKFIMNNALGYLSAATYFRGVTHVDKEEKADDEQAGDEEPKTPIHLAQPSSTPAESLTKYELKIILLDKMQKSHSFQTHEKHIDLYNVLVNFTMLDEAIASGKVNPYKVLKRSWPDDQDPPAGFDKEKKQRRKRKDSELSKDKEQSGSTSKGKTQSKPSSTNKSVNEKETVHDVALEADQPMNAKEDEVVNVEEHPQDDVAPKEVYLFKQPPRQETPDPKWQKELNAADGPEQTWFNDLVKAEKDP
ncbi:hypothetical protein Tco_1316929 [Tanacetum coccineum]